MKVQIDTTGLERSIERVCHEASREMYEDEIERLKEAIDSMRDEYLVQSRRMLRINDELTKHNNALRKRIAELISERGDEGIEGGPQFMALAQRVNDLKSALRRVVRMIRHGSLPPTDAEVKELLALANKD